MQKFKNYSLKAYLDQLSLKVPVPGGGSAAALVGSLGAALISMVTNYSLKKNKPKSIETKLKKTLVQSEKIRKQLLDIVDRDAQAYLRVVKTRHSAPKIKKAALRQASQVPMETCRLCYAAIQLTPLLVTDGNRYLLSDVKVAVELLEAAFNCAMVNVEVNQ